MSSGDQGSGDGAGGEQPAPPVQVQLYGRTDVGLVREHNEDNYLIIRLDDATRDAAVLRRHPLGARGTLMVVCDGMGGAAAGEVASGMAVEIVAEMMLGDRIPAPPEGWKDDERSRLARKLRQAAYEANSRIFAEARSNISRAGMGTTMTMLLLNDKQAIVAQVGDSRAYVWRAGHFTQVTRDQSLVNQLLELGHITAEQAKFFEHSNVILQALGVQEDVEVQLSRVELRRGDRILLCSDGLVGVVSDEEIAAVLGACDELEEAARILIELANGAGGPDNITCVVARVEGEALPPPAIDDVVRYQLWRIDPEPPPSDPPLPSSTSFADDPSVQIEVGRPVAEPAPRPLMQLVSVAVVIGLVIGSVLTGMVLYKSGVHCQVSSRVTGLALFDDGADTGLRSTEGGLRLRLRPGHHTLSLRGKGLELPARDIDVERGASCAVDFATAALAPLPSDTPPTVQAAAPSDDAPSPTATAAADESEPPAPAPTSPREP